MVTLIVSDDVFQISGESGLHNAILQERDDVAELITAISNGGDITHGYGMFSMYLVRFYVSDNIATEFRMLQSEAKSFNNTIQERANANWLARKGIS